MIALEPITPQNAMIFKDVRLRALRDTPNAFGSTYAKESQLSDADWIKRAAQWNSERSAAFVAMDGDTACGIVGSFLDQDDATRAHLVSMWTAPTHRHRGIGRLLVNEVLGWARVREARLGQGQRTVAKLGRTHHLEGGILQAFRCIPLRRMCITK